MMLAAEAGHYDVVELLLQHHADTEEQNLVDSLPVFTLSRTSFSFSFAFLVSTSALSLIPRARI